ncbi:DUF6933 domain-containing protein [Paenibacillus cremeus]|uniref:DUF6933 domain-containing protein n=1 Tax=Paenibacillus cremeus TaxID=2163881 RepID=A0A559KF80_9BACL|nr:hypothetical protein [Paenibacillus cremeus]TVY10783.1 hypothetical protein FPZ49_06705 [Paenibacillus cremeus]
MAIISCTKKLFEQSGFPESPVPEVGYQPLYSWHAHFFKMGRKNCLMLMNDLTRYQVFLYGMKKAHYKSFEDLFIQSLTANLKADELPEDQIHKYISRIGAHIYTKTHNRSLIGSLNDQILIGTHWIEPYLSSEELPLIEFNRRLNRTVMLKLKETYPVEAMKNALEIL